MFLSLITLAVALSLSVIAAYYSIAGLAAIFAAAVIPIMIMGSILELAKVVVTIWLHEYWPRARWLMKLYLVSAVIMLMLITSMGIFGFLSKAHSDQSLVSGNSQAKVSIFDEKIRTSKENIDANRRALKQMDEAVDQVMGRSADEKGAEKAVQIRRSQNKERARLIAEIDTEQKTVAKLNEEAAPLRAEFRKIEAEVGPIKYIAALIYGDNPDANILERAVRWVIILLVCVFDPLAIMMLLASTESLKWAREGRTSRVPEPEPPAYEPDDGPVDPEVLDQVRAMAKQELPTGELVSTQELFPENPHPPGWMFEPDPPLVPQAAEVEVILPELDDDSDEVEQESSDEIKAAMTRWKEQHPGDTLKNQRYLLHRGAIEQLPWLLPSANQSGFGTEFPQNPHKGDTFVRTDRTPNQVYKFNGVDWIQVDKSVSDSYTYNTAYIDHLIEKISQGEYDPELLSNSEQEQVEQRLQNTTNK
jgi:hypothetical protein